jgi:hypothetical protein
VELVYILKELWQRRILVALVVLAAVISGLALAYRVSVFPPSLHSKRTIEYGAASTQILVDARSSAIGDLRYDLTPLVARAGVLARLATTGEVADALARQLGLPLNSIDIQGPTVNPSQVAAAGAAQRSSQLLGEASGYRVKADTDGTLPVINVFTQAPTADRAIALANATFIVLGKVVDSAQVSAATPPATQARLIQLGRAKGGVVNPGASKQLAAIATIGVLIGGVILILVVSRFARAWREVSILDFASSVEPPVNGKGEGGPAVVERVVNGGDAVTTTGPPNPSDR